MERVCLGDGERKFTSETLNIDINNSMEMGESVYVSWPVLKAYSTFVEIGSFETNETRNCLVTDILLNIRKPAEWIRKR